MNACLSVTLVICDSSSCSYAACVCVCGVCRRADGERAVPVPGRAVHGPRHRVRRHGHLLRQRPQRRRPQRAAVRQDHGLRQVSAAWRGTAGSHTHTHTTQLRYHLTPQALRVFTRSEMKDRRVAASFTNGTSSVELQ